MCVCECGVCAYVLVYVYFSVLPCVSVFMYMCVQV